MRLLKKGYSGQDVKFLQRWLIRVGYAPEGMIANGNYGRETIFAVSRLRRAMGLPPNDGRFDSLIKYHLKRHGYRDIIPAIDFDALFPSRSRTLRTNPNSKALRKI